MAAECTCGDNGICTACVLETFDLEAQLMLAAGQALNTAINRPVNVVELPRERKAV